MEEDTICLKQQLFDRTKFFIAYVFYFFRNLVSTKKIVIKNTDETIDELKKSNRSMIRFGDGEIALIRGFDIGFQKYSDGLARELVNALSNKEVMVAIPETIYLSRLSQYKREDRKAWIYESLFSYPIYRKYCDSEVYYNSLVSRLYLPFDCTYDIIKDRYERIKKVWQGKKILIVEGEYSRLGVGNDLFKKSEKIDRILCPAKNAYEFIQNIEDAVISAHSNNCYDLTIVAIGPTSKVLINHLHYMGRFLDLGHIDIEYEWFLNGSTSKVAVKGKAVNEAKNGMENMECKDTKYLSEIICRISDEQ